MDIFCNVEAFIIHFPFTYIYPFKTIYPSIFFLWVSFQVSLEIGGMDYGFEINGLLGMDLLTRVGAIINLDRLQLELPDVET